MKKIFWVLILTINLGLISYAQEGLRVITLPYEEINARYHTPLAYQYVRESDIMWAKIVWRRVELTEKMNQILYFPTEPAGGYRSLIDVLLDGIHNRGLNAYKARARDAGQEFDIPMTEEEIHQEMGAKTEVQVVENMEGGYDSVTVDIPYEPTEIKSYIIKEIWFFDKQRSVMDFRIIGLCPVRMYYRDEDLEHTHPLFKKVFWVLYPEARPLLARSPVYTPFNDLKAITYDDVFQKRLFSGYIFMVSDPMRREVAEYEQGINALLRAQEIQNMITDFEQSLWEY